MVWRIEDPQGNESAKVRWDLIPYANGRGIDIGCGLMKALPHMIGVDIVRFPTGEPDVISDCRDLALFAPASLDFVYSSHLLEHLEDPGAVLARWFSLVKVGGHLILYLPHRDLYPRMGTPGANPEHKSDFAPSDIVSLMKTVGDWELVRNEDRNGGREYSFLQVYRKLAEGAGQVETWSNPKPERTACVIRYGGLGDALWASSLLPHLKAEGYHVTLYTEEGGAAVLRHDPNLDEIVIQTSSMIDPKELLAFWLWLERKFDRFVNLVGSVEGRLLPMPSDWAFHWPDHFRAQVMNRNYLETYHELAGLPQVYHQRFYPTEEELARARAIKASIPGPMIVLAPSGSSVPKWYPYVQRFLDLSAGKSWATFVLGDLRGHSFEAPPGRIIGTSLPIREALSLAVVADVVVAVESVVANASAFEDQLTVVLLGHSSPENLTKHWKNTVAVEPRGLPCWPCHRIHTSPFFCTIEKETKTSACHAVARPELLIDLIEKYLAAPALEEAENPAEEFAGAIEARSEELDLEPVAELVEDGAGAGGGDASVR